MSSPAVSSATVVRITPLPAVSHLRSFGSFGRAKGIGLDDGCSGIADAERELALG